ncbi:MAG: hypothetical protein FJ128_11300 [Deltaproteobacteria bacterium]|nr:hypothetical protein [Deltaproteobacteria bacterium]
MGWFGGAVLQTMGSVPGDYEVITVSTTAVGLTGTKIRPTSGTFKGLTAQAVLVSLDNGDVRFRIDGGLPTASNGHSLTSGDTLVLNGSQSLLNFRAIRQGDTNGILRVTYYY